MFMCTWYRPFLPKMADIILQNIFLYQLLWIHNIQLMCCYKNDTIIHFQKVICIY